MKIGHGQQIESTDISVVNGNFTWMKETRNRKIQTLLSFKFLPFMREKLEELSFILLPFIGENWKELLTRAIDEL